MAGLVFAEYSLKSGPIELAGLIMSQSGPRERAGMKHLDVTMKRPSELTPLEKEAWQDFLDHNKALGSPYFAIEFAECCEEARADTRVMIARRAGQIEAILPFHTGKFGYARPLAGPLGDVHGLICGPDCSISPVDMMQACGIQMFDFHSALASQTAFHDAAEQIDGSWLLDLSEGFDAWLARRREVNSKAFRNIRARRRKLEEADGGFRFVMADTSMETFEAMFRWKREQYKRTGMFDVFSVAWTRKLLEAIRKRESEKFTGLCSSLYVDGKLSAVHFGMASDTVCHYWFPAYDEDMSRMSPGLLLLVEMAKTASGLGHQALELGPGKYTFKKDLASYQIGLASGYLSLPSIQTSLRHAAESVTRTVEAAPLGRASYWPAKAARKIGRLAGFYAA